MELKTDSVKSLKYIALIVFVYLVYVLLSYGIPVPPSDSMFYIHAAYDFVRGAYEFPTQEMPYHHFMRWPVVFPLAFTYFVFGYGYLALSFFNLFFSAGIGILVFLISKRFYSNYLIAFAASLVAIVIPSEIFIPYIRSEPVAVLCTLLIFYILAKRNYKFLGLVLIGLLVAISVNATKISVFSFPCILIFWIKSNDYPLKRKLIDICYAGITSVMFYLVIMFFEYVFSGNFFIQYEVLTWWVLYSNIESQSLLSEMFSYSSQYRFIFGFAKDLFILYPRFMVFIILGFLSSTYLLIRNKKNTYTDIFFLTGIVGYLFFELFGAFAMVKINRYIAFPLTCLSIWSLRSIAEFLFQLKSKTISISMALIFSAVFLFLQVKGNNTINPMTRHCKNVIDIIEEDVKRDSLNISQVKLFFNEFAPVGLMEWKVQAQVYSDYLFDKKNLFQEKRPSKDIREGVRKYFITKKVPTKLIKNYSFIEVLGRNKDNPYLVYVQQG